MSMMNDEPIFSKVAKYYHTIKYLRFIQVYGQIKYRFKKPKINNTHSLNLRERHKSLVKPITKIAQLSSPNEVILLNQKRDISARSIWCNYKIDKLWIYNLHYFDFLNNYYTEADDDWYSTLLKRWMNENPPQKSNAWNAYTVSLRIVNWIKWLLNHANDDAALNHSLCLQARFLFEQIEIHILGNHLIANAKALLYAGLFFTGDEANKWFNKGFKLFQRELKEQILSDGGHFELSPMYHSIILEDLLDVMNLFQCYLQPFPDNWRMLAQKMFDWLETMCHPDEAIAFFNDAALGIAPSLHALKIYRDRLQLETRLRTTNEPIRYLQHSGYCRIEQGKAVLLVDIANVVASYQPGHAHSDTLSFELSLGRQRLIVNSGTSSYNEDAERLRQRGSKAHNTLIIDDKNSSDVWKSFRVGHRAYVHHVKMKHLADRITLSAYHDGYFRYGKILHKRTWIVNHQEILIRDLVFGKGVHTIEIVFHLHPNIQPKQKDAHTIFCYDQWDSLMAFIYADQSLQIKQSTYHPGFNLTITNKKIVIVIRKSLPAQCKTMIKWDT